MKNNIELKIEGQVVDINEQVQFSITKAFKDLSNPTNIINDWTKTIVIPFTENNNKLFGHIYNTDRLFVSSDTQHIGLYFDPSKKLDFKLFWNNSIIMEGYMKMTSIDNGKGYSINLFGGLGKVFQELKKLTPVLSNTADDRYYFTPFELEDGFYLTKYNISLSWEKPKNNYTDIELVNKIGFVPVNGGYYDSFDSKTIQLTSKAGSEGDQAPFMEFTDLLSHKYENSIYDIDSLIGEGLLPRQICDYRSYYMQPYIFMDEMFRILQNKTQELTEYTLSLDNSWFNTDNPYYANAVMLLKQLEHNSLARNSYAAKALVKSTYDANSFRWNLTDINNQKLWASGVYLDDVDGVVNNNEIIVINKNETLTVKYALKLNIRYDLSVNDFTFKFTNLADGASIAFYVVFVDPTDDTRFIRKQYYIVSPNNPYKLLYENCIVIQDSDWKVTTELLEDGHHNVYRDVYVDIVGEVALKEFQFMNNVKMNVMCYLLPDLNKIFNFGTLFDGDYIYPAITYDSIINYELSSNDNRSYDYVTFNDMWDNEYNFFDLMLKYTKMFNLIWDIDDHSKVITIKPMHKFFSENDKIEDWTNKVDFGSDFRIEPLIYDAKYYKLGYETSDIGLGLTYKTKFGQEYGDKIIDTKYNFNESTTNLIEGIKSPIVNTTNVLCWPDLYNGNVLYRLCLEPMLCLADSDNKHINGFGSFLFYRGIREFDNLGRLICISDDTPEMQSSHKYTYVESSNSKWAQRVTTYPWLDVVYEGLGTNLAYYFGLPKQKFDAVGNYNNLSVIYDSCWKNYIQEYTDPLNNKLSAYVYLTPVDFLQFRFNKLIKIDNQVYLVNKISDYSFGEKTKCELIRVGNIDNYTTDTLISLDVPTVTMIHNGLAASNSTDDIKCTIKTNIPAFSSKNIKIIYSTSPHGVLSIKSVSRNISNNTYDIIFSQKSFATDSKGKIEIIYTNNKQYTPIILNTYNWTINTTAGRNDDPVISTTNAKFDVNVVNVADRTSDIVVSLQTSYDINMNTEFVIEKKAGNGVIQLSKWTKLNNNPIINKITISQRAFTESGYGNLIAKYKGNIVARIPWHIDIVLESTRLGTILTTELTTGNQLKGEYYYNINTKQLLGVEDEELLPVASNFTDVGYIQDYGNGNLLLVYDINKFEYDNIKAKKMEGVHIYVDAATYVQSPNRPNGAPSRYPSASQDITKLKEITYYD